MTNNLEIAWDRGRALVSLMAGMVGPVAFDLVDGRRVQPFAVAPWSDDTGEAYEALPNLLKRLRGEWPCVPFGAPQAPAGLPDDWRGGPVAALGRDFHGYGSHHLWDVEQHDASRIVLRIDYPADHAVACLRREIAGVPGAAAIACTLEIQARRDTGVPIALHPVFALPEALRSARLDPGPFEFGITYPIAVESGVSRLSRGAAFADLSRVPAGGATVALDRLPLDFDTEELVQLCGARGRVTLTDAAAGHSAYLDYDPAVFGSVLLWISNRGRGSYPWNGRFCAIGIEPVCGAFDLGPEVSRNPANPIAARGIATAIDLTAGQAFRTSYRIGVEPSG